DASGRGIGIYFPWRRLGLFCELPNDPPTGTIYFHEALAICSAVHRLPLWEHAGRKIRRLAILSDNTNAVAAFTTLRAHPPYHQILMSTVDVLIEHNVDLRVDHIPGEHNVIADALSRRKFELVYTLIPNIDLLPFTPPRDALGE
ncbi:hypothetical protein C2E23DRAFT_714215, partial [Lenzites betulinus]